MLSRGYKWRHVSKYALKDWYRSIYFLAGKVEPSESLSNYSALRSIPERCQTCDYFPTHRLHPNSKRTYASESLPPHVILKMPSLSPTMTEGNLVEWKKNEGDEINPGDVICIIETDKATLENESQEEGFLAKILVPDGSKNIAVNQPIGLVAENSEDVPKFSSFSVQEPISSSISKTEQIPDSSTKDTKPDVLNDDGLISEEFLAARISPSARKLIIENKLNFSEIKPKGPKGIITKEDVLNELKQGPKKKITDDEKKIESIRQTIPSELPPKKFKEQKSVSVKEETHPDQYFVDLPTTQIRKIIAKRLLESKFNSPHYYVKKEIILDSILEFRASINKQLNKPVSINDIIIKAVANTLNEVKEANVYWNENNQSVSFFSAIDISFAVATDKGLFTPIIKNANLKSLSEISTEVKALAEKAKLGTLKPEEFQGGSFCISNLGMFAIDHFSAIINPPQCGILAVGKKEDAVKWLEKEDGSSGPQLVSKMEITLSADNRAIDGGIAGKFLETLSKNIEDPGRLLL